MILHFDIILSYHFLIKNLHLLLIFFLGGEPGLDALPGLHESQPLSNLAGVVGEDSGNVRHHEKYQVRMQLKEGKVKTIWFKL